MNLNKIYYLLLLFVLLKAEDPYQNLKQTIGIKASNVAGYGIFYGYKPTQNWKIQATGIYYLLDSKIAESSHKISNYTLGLEVQKDIVQEINQRVYLMSGCYYYYDDDQEINEEIFRVKNNSYNYGFAFGYEYFFDRITLGAEIGYKIYTDHKVRTENSIDMSEYIRESKIGAGINLGFIF